MTDRPEPVPHPRPRRPLRGRSVRTAAGLVACALLVIAWLLPSAAAGPDRVDPAALPQGPAPGVVHLVRDTIRDGDRSIPATVRGRHDALWTVRGGYVLRDYDVGPRRLTRVVFVADTGDRRVLARSRHWVDVEVSPGGGLVAVQLATGPLGEGSTVTVEEPATGRVVGRRELRLATLVAVTRSRVLLGLRSRWRDPSTVWWNLESDRTRRLVDQVAVSADVAHDRMVLLRPVGEFCHRVAPLSDPRRTLWRSCRTMPHQWSPDGRHALATWAYFDAAGTDRWWVVDGGTGESLGRIVGRLDWQAVWEDDGHFLVNAQGDRGGAAVVRCDLEGTCERATRLWDTPLPNEPSLYYRSPPVVLAGR